MGVLGVVLFLKKGEVLERILEASEGQAIWVVGVLLSAFLLGPLTSAGSSALLNCLQS